MLRLLATLGLAGVAFAYVSISPASSQEITNVSGAGSTFAYPILSKWARSYQRWVAGGGDLPIAGSSLDDPPTAPALDYEPIGSLAGTMRIKDAAVDFGASDVPLKSEELAKLGLGQFPIVIGGVVAVTNIDGVGAGQLKLNGQILADIFLGKITKWSDATIKAANPDLKLPDAAIAVIRRSDGSGTTYNFTNYLSKVSPEWQARMGYDLMVAWPTGTGAKGNDGIAKAVAQTKNSIGYIEYAQAMQAKLSYALIANQTGRFVKPEQATFQAAVAGADWAKSGDFNLMLTNAGGENAYPMVATVFALMHRTNSSRTARAALNFFQWALEKGGPDATELGYVPLPQPLVGQIKSYWAQNLKAKL